VEGLEEEIVNPSHNENSRAIY